MGDELCGFPSSVSALVCILPPGHQADTQTRFHRFGSAPPSPQTLTADDLMRVLSADNPRSRYHQEQLPNAYSGWTCIPLKDVVPLRNRLVDSLAGPEPEWRVHDHSPAFSCREYTINGRLIGFCLLVTAVENGGRARGLNRGGNPGG